MADVRIYHTPRCSKSRAVLKLLRVRGIEPIDLIRRRESPFKQLGLKDKAHDRNALIAAMVEHPILIERPIVVRGGKARLSRPPEQVLEIL